jgi:chromosome segregation ATPase
LQLDNEKLGMAQELSRESAEEFDDLVAERDALQAELDGLRAELGAATRQTEAHIAKINEVGSAMTALRSDHGLSQSTAEKRAIRIAELEDTVNYTLADVAAAKSLAEAHATTISTLEKDLDVSTTESADQSRSLIVDILAQRQRLSQAAAAWRKASSQAQHHVTALASSNTQIKTLMEQVDAFEAERSAMSQQLQSHTQRGKALDTANETIHDLESQVETLAAECAGIAERLDIVSTSEASLKKQIEDSPATQNLLDQATLRAEEVGRELSEARVEITRLESEIAATKAAADSNMNEVESGLRQELDQVKAELVSSEARASESVEALTKLSSQIERLESMGDVDNSLDRSQDMSLIERTEININHTATTIESLRQHVASIETTLRDERAQSEKLSTQSQELASRLAEVETAAARDAELKNAEMQTLQATLDAKHEEVMVKTERVDELEKECEHLRVQVSELENKLDQAAESATDHTLALQTEKAALQEKLATTSEKAEALRMEVGKTMSKNQRLNLQVTTLTTELEGTRTSLVEVQSTVEVLRTGMEKLEVEKEKTVGLLKYQETETSSRYVLIVELEIMTDEVETTRSSLSSESCKATRPRF